MIAAPLLTPHNGEDEAAAEQRRESQPALDRPQAQLSLKITASLYFYLMNTQLNCHFGQISGKKQMFSLISIQSTSIEAVIY